MKTQKTIIILFFVLTFTSTINSCTKEGDKTASCRIVTVSQSGPGPGTIQNLTYNNDGKISTLSATTGSSVINKVFNYSGNTIIVYSTNGSGAFNSRDSITLDSKGRPLNIRQYFNQAGTNWYNLNLEYNGDDLLRVQQSGPTGGTTFLATYSNGNMVSLQSASSTVTFEYYTDKKIQPGDFLDVTSLVQYGVRVYPQKNLIKTIDYGGGNISNFSYEMNSDGLISKATGTTASDVTTLTYQYKCD
jgi:hypothetical protein